MRVLVAEPSAPVAEAIRRVLEQRGYEVTVAGSCEAACGHVGPFDCGVFPLTFPDGPGISLAGWLIAEERVIDVIFFDTMRDADQRHRAGNLGVVVERDEGVEVLSQAIQEVVHARHEHAAAVGAPSFPARQVELKSGRRPKRQS